MTALNSEGLEKARAAIIGNPFNDEQLGRIISAYLAALPPIDGLEIVAELNRIIAEEAEDFADAAGHAIEAGERPDLWDREVEVAVHTLSKASSVIAGLTAERDEARRGEYSANEYEPTWGELTSVWKARAETAEQEAKALLDALNQVGLTPEQKSWVESFLKTRAFLAARQALEDHNG